MKKPLALISGVLLLTSFVQSASAEWFSKDWNGMGTKIRAEVWVDEGGADAAEKAFTAVDEEFDRLEALMSVYIDSSEVSKVNRLAAKQAVVITPELFHLIEKAQRVSELSGGAFDITFASIGKYYNYREGLEPDARQIEENLPAINYRWIEMDPAALSIHFKDPRVTIDLGGIAKGYAVDKAIEKLAGLGIQYALVSAGGDSRLMGDKHGRPWIVGVKDPRLEDKNAVLIPLENTAISTSGDYERFFMHDGVRVHHIISPKTGKSAEESQSVTIIGPDATTTDALSTTVFILGAEKGLELIEKLPGIDAIIIDRNRKMHYSSELQPPTAE
ncbi:FAD:protein FMN transferase [Hahella sp. CR1]|uniref:FAD:protein FMN transferase n=1 Tax=Hahella sp. CR1 TaxID=2992807 RepID=UPI002442E5D4|nr:FAD:protein FMN transferase [Hahella sp. CR1]MDG9667975.1 FAD:protein FMN transferase [Hahella sp. CR1]